MAYNVRAEHDSILIEFCHAFMATEKIERVIALRQAGNFAFPERGLCMPSRRAGFLALEIFYVRRNAKVR